MSRNGVAYRIIEKYFPDTVEEIEITSPRDNQYNCIAWAAEDTSNFWWPLYPGYWPSGVPRETTLEAFKAAYALSGYVVCDSDAMEPGVQKIAIYADLAGKPTHAARQLANGQWTSKLGPQWDVSHLRPDSLAGQEYGQVAVIMKRPAVG